MRQGRGSEATEAVFFASRAKKPLHTGVRTDLGSLSVRLSVYV